jgi:enoyl-CoA hydratase/carnithine racemase
MPPGDNPFAEHPKVLYEVKDRIATITLNDPEHLNFIGHGPGSMEEGLIHSLWRADLDDEVRCVVVTGAGRAFSSGGGSGSMYINVPPSSEWSTAVDLYRFLSQWNENLAEIRNMRKPMIGAINGLCYGSGFNIAAQLDMLIAVDTATLGLIETRFGATGIDVFTYLVGPQWAKFIALSGELLTAKKAKEIGLILDVFPAETFHDKVYDLARRVAAMPPDAVILNRRLVNAAANAMGWNAAVEVGRALDAITNSVAGRATSIDGRNFHELRRQGDWAGFKDARDAAFKEPWLAHEQAGSSLDS